MRPLRGGSKSHAKLAAALGAMGHKVSKSTIPKLLEVLQYRRQVNRKTLESSRNPDRERASSLAKRRSVLALR